jgi:transcriptional regulator with XRE-family HTH domain
VDGYDEIIFIKNFGKRLRALRINNNLSQENLANDADIPINQVGRIERAEISTSIRTIFKLSKALNIKPYKFFIDE